MCVLTAPDLFDQDEDDGRVRVLTPEPAGPDGGRRARPNACAPAARCAWRSRTPSFPQVHREHLAQLPADREHRDERGHGLLEDDGRCPPPGPGAAGVALCVVIAT
ncbi:hypothetical protein O4U47_04720 [Nocardiopsis sp. LSu2-4]|uniref:Uncharacterized protein n=1 Tax=Nocardiopsis suaedae TaxID=3018444 RepID=A0ABT4TGU5_9ACTN|nr:hypothetical protein [Nocardiopsis suaedae]MDA2803806.1 hypothetical protein [Nocardiopsis suaedae]